MPGQALPMAGLLYFGFKKEKKKKSTKEISKYLAVVYEGNRFFIPHSKVNVGHQRLLFL